MDVPPNDSYQPQLGWLDIFDSTLYPILEALSSYLTVADFLVLCQACKRLDKLKHWVLGKVSNVNIRLKDFLGDPVAFRSHMARCGGLISGPFALDILELSHRRVPYLDVFIKEGDGVGGFFDYLEEKEKYEYHGEDETNRSRGIFVHNSRPGVKLRVTTTDVSPIQAILTSASTTAYVNVITWNKVYAIFPQQTLISHLGFPLRPLDDEFGSGLNELADQGWTTRDIVWPDFATVQTSKVSGLRRVGDRSTLVIPLETDFVRGSSTPDFVIEHVQFNVPGTDSRYDQRRGYAQSQFRPDYYLKIRVQEVVSPALRHSYITASTEWNLYLTSRLQRWTWLELYKLAPNKRPAQLANAPLLSSDVSTLRDFAVPASWDYADDQLPKWYREWEQTQAKRESGFFPG
ncbi:hypothetical protein GQ53DRAFT_432057 [Thozetella sp. PMI_491]|nr:hypothetical protein GQ53DRAFT_432057 [Thozetella sp. PMI_491]